MCYPHFTNEKTEVKILKTPKKITTIVKETNSCDHQMFLGTYSVQFSHSVMSNSLWPPWTVARQASLSITNSRSALRLTSIESVMPSSQLVLCCHLLPPSIFPSIRVFSNELALRITWPKVLELQLQHQSFQWTPRTDLLGLAGSPCSPRDSQESSPTHKFFSTQLSL